MRCAEDLHVLRDLICATMMVNACICNSNRKQPARRQTLISEGTLQCAMPLPVKEEGNGGIKSIKSQGQDVKTSRLHNTGPPNA